MNPAPNLPGHSTLNQGKGVWTPNNLRDILRPKRKPKTAEELALQYGNRPIPNPDKDLFWDNGNEYVQIVARLAHIPRPPEIETMVDAFHRSFAEQKQVFNMPGQQRLDKTEELLARLTHGDHDIVRIHCIGFGQIDPSLYTNPARAASRNWIWTEYLIIQSLVTAVRQKRKNRKVNVHFHDLDYSPNDYFLIESEFKCDNPMHGEVSISNDAVSFMAAAYDENSIIITTSGHVPYRQILAEIILPAIEEKKSYPSAVISFPGGRDDFGFGVSNRDRNHSSDLVSKWIDHYTDSPLPITKLNGQPFGGMVLHTRGRVS